MPNTLIKERLPAADGGGGGDSGGGVGGGGSGGGSSFPPEGSPCSTAMYAAIGQLFPGAQVSGVIKPADGGPWRIQVALPDLSLWEIAGATCSGGSVSLQYARVSSGGIRSA